MDAFKTTDAAVKIPPKRLNAVKKDDFAVLKRLENELGINAEVNIDGNVELEGDGGKTWIAQQVLTAIALGFDQEKALKLLNDDYYIEVIDLEQFFSNEKMIERYKARVIGKEGKAKKTLEELTDAHISIWENKIAILGKYEELQDAKEAIQKILQGSTHSGVYGFLEKKRRHEKRTRMF
ncbi:MAG: KH domain-containing protein [Candidatus Micrarchaeia archaeon]